MNSGSAKRKKTWLHRKTSGRGLNIIYNSVSVIMITKLKSNSQNKNQDSQQQDIKLI